MPFTAEEQEMLDLLKALGQGHIEAGWPADANDDDKKRLLAQVRKLNSEYPDGLRAYVDNAKRLLVESKEGINPFDGYTPYVPAGERLTPGTPEFRDAEDAGMQEIHQACFVIVAGGLGERLGYSGIKLELPGEITTGRCFLQYYCDAVLALQRRARGLGHEVELPVCIMTSGDTHDRTLELLQANNYFGMSSQIEIVKQEKVPSLVDNDAHFAMDDPFTISTKPHGHGDVHTLLHSAGLAKKWAAEGRKWVCFLQDTNGLVFRSIPAAVGVSAKNNFVVNSLTVPRRPGEAVGGICGLKHADGRDMTINVEYNQLDPLLKASGKGGDVADESGFSPFPGNINVLVFALGPYVGTLERTNGAIPEFVNPKYADAEKTVFKKPTRLECMMQDFPKLLSPSDKVGFTQIDRWLSFSAVKNNVEDAAAKLKSTGVAESASSAEADMYLVCRKMLAMAGVQVEEEAGKVEYAGLATTVGARIVLAPSFGVTVAEVQSRFPSPAQVSVSARSTLVLEGDVVVEGLELDGALVVRAAPGTKVVIRGLKVKNDGWEFAPLGAGDNAEEKFQIRGYTLKKLAADEHVVDNNGQEVVLA